MKPMITSFGVGDIPVHVNAPCPAGYVADPQGNCWPTHGPTLPPAVAITAPRWRVASIPVVTSVQPNGRVLHTFVRR